MGKDRICGLRDEQGNITHSMDEIIKVAERFYTRIYTPASLLQGKVLTERTSLACDDPLVTKEEVEKALKDTKREKAAGDDGTTVDLLKEEILYWKSLRYYFRNA